MSLNYVDTVATIQVIGSVFKHPYLLEQNDKYFFSEDDFVDRFHKTIFGSVYNMYCNGVRKIGLDDVHNYLSSRPARLAEFKAGKGEEYIVKASEMADVQKFDYYYNRLKKFSLLRAYDNYGIDVRFLYDPSNVMDLKKAQIQEDWLDNVTLEEIAVEVDKKIDSIRATYVDNSTGNSKEASSGIFDLIERLKETPEVGVPLYGNLINTITRGARLKKFYLRSAATGVGKTRSMIADACNIACSEIYQDGLGWIKNGTKEPTLFITTEQELDELQTMLLAFLSNVEEETILNGSYNEDEYERVLYAAKVLKESPLYVEELPDFSLKDIENTIKRNIREHGCKYIFNDYIHTSLKILEEITKRSGGVKLREDNILFMISIRLKDLCNEYGVFIMSATQLNSDSKDASLSETNQNLLRGAKSIADKIDFGSILMAVKQDDLTALDSVLGSGGFEKPNIRLTVYKNRRGKFKSVTLWCKGNLGTCRVNPMFLTDDNYELVPIEDIKIIVKERESAF